MSVLLELRPEFAATILPAAAERRSMLLDRPAYDDPFQHHVHCVSCVSTDDQDLSLQIDALTKHGIPKTYIFMDKLSGAKTERPGLTKCLESLRSGDTLVVWRLDRLGRSMRHLIALVEDLRTKKIGFRSLSEGAIDTTSASGELIFNIFSALAQFERRLIQESHRISQNPLFYRLKPTSATITKPPENALFPSESCQ